MSFTEKRHNSTQDTNIAIRIIHDWKPVARAHRRSLLKAACAHLLNLPVWAAALGQMKPIRLQVLPASCCGPIAIPLAQVICRRSLIILKHTDISFPMEKKKFRPEDSTDSQGLGGFQFHL